MATIGSTRNSERTKANWAAIIIGRGFGQPLIPSRFLNVSFFELCFHYPPFSLFLRFFFSFRFQNVLRKIFSITFSGKCGVLNVRSVKMKNACPAIDIFPSFCLESRNNRFGLLVGNANDKSALSLPLFFRILFSYLYVREGL